MPESGIIQRGRSAMFVASVFRRLRDRLKAFGVRQDGNVAVLFGIAILPIMAAVGSAVDYTHASSVKTAMQAALDSTALMLSRDAATKDDGQLDTSAKNYFNALFTRSEGKTVSVNATYAAAGGSSLTVTASVVMDTHFMKIFGYPQVTLNSTAVVKWGTTKLRVALVLDNTGSMDDAGKMPALITATNNLLTQLKGAAATNGDVYVSIIPFVKDVNLGASNYNADWIDWTDWEDEPPYIKTNKPSNWDQIGPGNSCPFSEWSHGFGCAPSPTSTSTVSYIPSSGSYTGFICPGTDNGTKVSRKASVQYNGCYNSVQVTNTIASGWQASCGSVSNCTCSGSGSNKKCIQSYYQHNWIKNARSTWNGCVADRGDITVPNTNNYDTNVTAPSGSAAKQYPAEQYTSCPQPVMGLNYNWTSMTSLVNSMSPGGNTNQGIGLQLGWMSLVGGGPFTAPAKDKNYEYQDIIILLSDGLNTQNRWYTSHASIDARQQMTCNNAKAAGVTIYSIQVNTSGDPTSSVLQQCATDSGKFFVVTSAGQINTIFNQIGTNLSKLRVAK
jgi:Flp pilus assembly protein TadG